MKALITILFFSFVVSVKAQQNPLSTMFWNNYSAVNPAVSGLYYKHRANAQYRNQWDGVNGAPNTIVAGYDAKLDFLHGGLGFTYMHDAIGFSRENRVNLNYSYHIKLGEKSVLAAGVAAGMTGMEIKPYWITPSAPAYKDPALTSSNKHGSAFFVNIGFVFKRENLNIGLSSTQINEPTFRTTNFSMTRHYVLFADYLVELSPVFDLKPQVMVRTDAVKMSADFNLLATLKKQYWLGVSYRSSSAICFMGGWDIREKFRVGYSYDLPINKLSSISRGSHEIVLGFMLK